MRALILALIIALIGIGPTSPEAVAATSQLQEATGGELVAQRRKKKRKKRKKRRKRRKKKKRKKKRKKRRKAKKKKAPKAPKAGKAKPAETPAKPAEEPAKPAKAKPAAAPVAPAAAAAAAAAAAQAAAVPVAVGPTRSGLSKGLLYGGMGGALLGLGGTFGGLVIANTAIDTRTELQGKPAWTLAQKTEFKALEGTTTMGKVLNGAGIALTAIGSIAAVSGLFVP